MYNFLKCNNFCLLQLLAESGCLITDNYVVLLVYSFHSMACTLENNNFVFIRFSFNVDTVYKDSKDAIFTICPLLSELIFLPSFLFY